MSDKGRAEADETGAYHLDRDPVPIENWNSGACANGPGSAIHVEGVRSALHRTMLEQDRVALDPPHMSFAHDIFDGAEPISTSNIEMVAPR